MEKEISDINWDEAFNSKDVSSSRKIFINTIKPIVIKYTPKTKIDNNHKKNQFG